MNDPRQDADRASEASSLRAAASASLQDVDALGLSGSDRSVVLALLLASRLRLDRSSSRTADADPAPNPRETSEQTTDLDNGDLLSRVASGLKVSREVVELVYDAKDGQLGVVLSPKRLASDKANATRQIAQIVAAGRQAAGLDEWTPIAAIRSVVSDYGRLDSGNFAAHVQGGGLDDVFLFRGKGTGREVKVTRGGMETAAELIVRVAAPSGQGLTSA